jgi:hypothetical protein
MKRTLKATLAGLGAGAAALAGVAAAPETAVAATNPDRLQAHAYTCDFTVDPADCVNATDGSFARWVTFPNNGDDSPQDANRAALVVHTISADPTAYDYVEVYSTHTRHINKPAANVKNISFDSYQPADTGGSPRISVFFTNPLVDGSSYVSLDEPNCTQPLLGDWVRSDATGRTALGCTIYTSNGTPYASTGTQSAWATLVAANPGARVSFSFMVFDIPSETTTNAVDYRVDRIALGTPVYYNRGPAPVSCTTEANC